MPARATPAAALAVLLALSAGACASAKTADTPGARVIAVKLTDAGCDPARIKVPAGPATFKVTNDNADAVSELEVQQGGRVVGEVENLTPGLNGSFSITLHPGEYVTSCPGGSGSSTGRLTVTGGATATTATPDAAATKAVADYRVYVEHEAAELVATTTTFVAAVERGDVATAKSLFPTARTNYESIEPIAESFGNLDPEIDARVNDVPAGQFQGFHRIERQLWVSGDTTGMQPVARALLANVKRLQSLVPTIRLEPAQLANGAVELLNEVASSKITGEEDRYSHTDLWDFEANLDGARAAYEALRPLIAAKDADLVSTLDRQFAATMTALGKYRHGSGFVLYTTLTQADTHALAAGVDALADSLARLAPLVVTR